MHETQQIQKIFEFSLFQEISSHDVCQNVTKGY